MNKLSLESWLTGAVMQLQEALDPEQVILFGSWARNSGTRHSDVDLFIVWDCALPPLERIGRVLTLLAHAPCPVEVIVYTPEELTKRRDRPFIQQLMAEGRVLYERGKAPTGSAAVVPAGD